MANSARARLRRERGPHIDRHLMGRCRPSLSQIVGGHTYDDTRRCGGPTGLKRRQQRRSHGFLHGFGAFSQRDAAHLLPRFFQPNVRLLCPFFLRGFVAGLCVAAELGLLFPKLPQKRSEPPECEEGTSLDTPCCSGKPAGCAKSPSVRPQRVLPSRRTKLSSPAPRRVSPCRARPKGAARFLRGVAIRPSLAVPRFCEAAAALA